MNSEISLSELKAICIKLKASKKKVVFTNGVFDLIHAGHVDYLSKAKSLGDVLIVGLNTDDSVRRIKGNVQYLNRKNVPLLYLTLNQSIM